MVDDQRSGKRWTFQNIDLSLTRPKEGGVVFKLGSGGPENPWSLSAAAISGGQGSRMIEVAANKVPLKDLQRRFGFTPDAVADAAKAQLGS